MAPSAAPLTLHALGITTSEALIQKLRGPADPVVVNDAASQRSICKIDLARLAWTQSQSQSRDPSPSTAVNIPQAASLLLAWILDALTRAARGSGGSGKAKKAPTPTAASSPIADPAYYTLLADLLQANKGGRGGVAASSTTTLPPQTPLTILSALLSLDVQSQRQCLPHAAEPVALLLAPVMASLASGQATRAVLDEQLTQIFEMAGALTDHDDDGDSGDGESASASAPSSLSSSVARALARVLQTLRDPYLEAMAETSALSQKSHATFISSSLKPWAHAMQNPSTSASTARRSSTIATLHQLIADIGEGCLFGAYGIKSVVFPSAFPKGLAPSVTLADVVTTATTQSDTALAATCPRLARASIRAVRRHNGELQSLARHGGGSNKSNGVGAAEDDIAAADADDDGGGGGDDGETRRNTSLYAHLFKNLLQPLIHAVLRDARSCAALLDVLHDSRISSHLASLPAWTRALNEVAVAPISAIQGHHVDDASFAIAALRTLWKIDEEVVRPRIADIFRAILSATTHSLPATQREAHALLDDLFKAFARSQDTPELLAILGRAIRDSSSTTSIAFEPRRFNETIATYAKNSITPPQVKQVLQSVIDLVRLTRTEDVAAAVGTKRNSAGGGDAASNASPGLLTFVHPILAATQIPPAMFAEVKEEVQEIGQCLVAITSASISGEAGMSAASPPASKRARNGKATTATTTATTISTPASASTACAAAALWAFYGLCAGIKAVDVASGQEAFPQTTQLLATLRPLWPALLAAADSAATPLLVAVARVILFALELRLQSGGRAGDSPTWLPEDACLAHFWESTTNHLSSSSSAPLWELLLARFAFVIEHTASAQVLAALAQRLMETLAVSQDSSPLHAISLTASRSAEFLELKRWRAAIVSYAMQHSDDEKAASSAAEVLSALAAFPLQYLPSDVRDTVLLRTLSVTNSAGVDEQVVSTLRTRLMQTAGQSQSGSLSDRVTAAVKASLPLLAADTRGAVDSSPSLPLLRLWLAKLRDNHQITAEELQRVVDGAMADKPALQVVVADVLAGASTALHSAVRLPALDLQSVAAAAPVTTTEDSHLVVDWLKRARLALVLAGLDPTSQQPSQLTPAQSQALASIDGHFARIAGRGPDVAQEYLALAAVLLRCSPRSVQSVGEGTIASLEGMLGGPSSSQHASIEKAFQRFTSLLTPQEYDGLLATMAARERRIDGASLITTALALRFGPEGTLLIAQKHFTRLLLRLQTALSTADADAAVDVADALTAIATICNGRAMVIRPQDATLLLAIASRAVAPSLLTLSSLEAHLESARASPLADRIAHSSAIFTTILDILNTLVRLRKDLLLPLLPQLSILLTQLPRLFVRPLSTSLHSTQTRRLLTSYPLWLARTFVVAEASQTTWLASGDADITLTSEGGLTQSDARYFARILDTITSKTTAMSRREAATANANLNSGKAGGAESLSKPFSKHAIYVILAYINAVLTAGGASGSLRAFIPPHVRNEMRQGLAALCQVINESERDWILATELLDDGGKNLLKDIWRQWDQQRYKGE